MKRKPTRRFVVGRRAQDPSVVYGRRWFLAPQSPNFSILDYCYSMTAEQAIRAMERSGRVIYELVPVELPR